MKVITMKDKISVNIKDPIVAEKLDKHRKYSNENVTALVNRLLREYFLSEKPLDLQDKIRESLENLDLLLISADPNFKAIKKEVTQIKCLISQS